MILIVNQICTGQLQDTHRCRGYITPASDEVTKQGSSDFSDFMAMLSTQSASHQRNFVSDITQIVDANAIIRLMFRSS